MRRPLSERRAIAARVRGAGSELGENDEGGRHSAFLAAAIEGGEPEAFASYCSWAARVQGARGVPVTQLRTEIERLREVLGPDAADEVSGALELGLDAIDRGPEPQGDRPEDSGALGVYLGAALNGDRQAALAVARERLGSGWSHLDVYADLLEAAQIRVGEMWADAEITVAQEHMATAVTQFVVTSLFGTIPPAAERRGSAVICCAEGERHQVGAHLVADALEADGWSASFLGGDPPVDDVAQTIADRRPDLLGISVTILANVDGAVRLVEAVRANGEPPRLLLGGQAMRLLPSLGDELEAGAATDVRAAVVWARGLEGQVA